MRTIIFSILFLILEAGVLLFFAVHHALDVKFTLLLLVLMGKNVFLLYSQLQKRK